MAGQAPWRQQEKLKTGSDVVVSAAAVPSSKMPAPAALVACATFLGDLSCASTITEDLASSPQLDSMALALTAQHALATILDSGTTTTLINDQSFFWTYSEQGATPVKTANHGSLITFGRGTCFAWLRINGQRHRVRFSNCLHAPDATFNLLSV